MMPIERDGRADLVVRAVSEYLDVTPPTILVMAQDGMLLKALRLMRSPDVGRLAAGAGSGEAFEA